MQNCVTTKSHLKSGWLYFFFGGGGGGAAILGSEAFLTSPICGTLVVCLGELGLGTGADGVFCLLMLNMYLSNS